MEPNVNWLDVYGLLHLFLLMLIRIEILNDQFDFHSFVNRSFNFRRKKREVSCEISLRVSIQKMLILEPVIKLVNLANIDLPLGINA